MTRLIVILLLVLLPAQLVWATAAPYCAHEPTTEASKHVGHHEHKHQAGESSAPSEDGLGAYHPDCETCHLGAAASLVPPLPDMTVPAHATARSDHIATFRSHVPPGLERPDIAQQPAAARFGGGVAFDPLYR